MAHNTDPALRKQVIYSVYVRAHTTEGTFNAIVPDLDRIKALGADYIWFMPIHPIGVKGKKGSLGCPYANRDYRAVNPAYGTMADFKHLCDEIHARGMKVMIDVVYNHTSPDSVLRETHPEFFYKKPDGTPGNHVGEWTDVIDLDYNVPALWDYQIESLVQWAALVDGFRCDVASFVPVEFWKRARAAVEAVHPGVVWLAESVHNSFGEEMRQRGLYCATDAEAFEAFDMEYEYDVRETFDAYLRGEAPLSAWTNALNAQETEYPANYNKLRFLENHDQQRIATLVRSDSDLANYTAMLYFLKGATLLYAGQEWADDHLPSLFEREPIDRATGKDLTPLLQTLRAVKRDALDADDAFFARTMDKTDVAVMARENADARKIGIFSLKSRPVSVELDVPDGSYVNLVDGTRLSVLLGSMRCDGKPIIFRVDK